jgi:hypothetical protein
MLGNDVTHKPSTAPHNCLFYVVRMEMSDSQDAQITNKKGIYIYRHIYTQYILALYVMYSRTQMWSLSTEAG